MLAGHDASHMLGLICVLLELTVPGQADVYSSISQVKRMVRNEGKLLQELRNILPDKIRNSKEFSKFYKERLSEFKEKNLTAEMTRLHHPNGVYVVLREFAEKYEVFRDPVLHSRSPQVQQLLHSVADSLDVKGALYTLLKLQEVYDLEARDMIDGNYFNVTGPKLSYMDAYSLGSAGFNNGQHRQSVEWVGLAASGKFLSAPHKVDLHDNQNVTLTSMYELLGRALIKTDKWQEAKHLYQTLTSKEREEEEEDDDVITKLLDLVTKPKSLQDTAEEIYHNHFPLCASHGKLATKQVDPRLRCRHRGLVPYFQYKEEILSVSPYLSIIYNVVTDKENWHIRKLSMKRMTRAVVSSPEGFITSYRRTSQVDFLDDKGSQTVAAVTRRIGYITSLNTSASSSGFLSPTQSASEPLQVVNYGLGGHFSLHKDPFEFYNKMTQNVLTYSGNRLATFLIYLSDVQVGGYTTFPRIPLVLTPVKNSAVFWYNYNPSGDMDEGTWHAGCPVVVGEKWVANKWILTHGNTFVRRCGLGRNATQLDIEPDMLRGYKD